MPAVWNRPFPFGDQLRDYVFHSREHIANCSRPENGHEQTIWNMDECCKKRCLRVNIRAIPQFLSLVSALFKCDGHGENGTEKIQHIREKSVVYEGRYLLYSSAYELRKSFIVTQLVEEVMTANYDKLSSWEGRVEVSGTLIGPIRSTKPTQKIETVYLAILFSQEQERFRRRCSVD